MRRLSTTNDTFVLRPRGSSLTTSDGLWFVRRAYTASTGWKDDGGDDDAVLTSCAAGAGKVSFVLSLVDVVVSGRMFALCRLALVVD